MKDRYCLPLWNRIKSAFTFSSKPKMAPEDDRKVIAVAGVGDIGKFVCEELQKAEGVQVVVLTRNKEHDWCKSKSIPFRQTDYSHESLLKVLNNTRATTLISLLNPFDKNSFLSVHENMIAACRESDSCKRIITDEWIGDIETHPLSPPYYAETRVPIRKMLDSQQEIEHTAICPGWLIDHFIPEKKTYMKHAPFSPVNPDEWKAVVRGDGDEPVSFVLMRDVAKAVVVLCKLERGSWDPVTFIASDWGSFEGAIRTMEAVYGKSMPREYKSLETVQNEKNNNDTWSLPGISAQIEEMGVLGHFCVPKAKALKQMDKFFKDVEFRDFETALRDAQKVDFL